jgi:DNA-binding MarR family transcriptional regulator
MSSVAPTEGPQYRALLQVLRTAETLWAVSRPFFERWALSSAQFNLLNLVADHPEGLAQVELSRELLTHRSNVTGLVDRLEKKDLVVRKAAAADRRLWRVVATAQGRSLVDEIRPAYHAAVLRVVEGISDAEAEGLFRALSFMEANGQRLAVEETSP